jgi:hypothetical protein
VSRACGECPKGQKVRELGSNLRYARLLSGFLPEFLRRNKTNPQQHRCQRPPTSVATFCEHLCQQNAARQFNRSEVSFNSRRRVAESKLGKQVRSHSLTKAATPSPTSKVTISNQISASKPTTSIPYIICRIASSPEMSQSAVVSPLP